VAQAVRDELRSMGSILIAVWREKSLKQEVLRYEGAEKRALRSNDDCSQQLHEG
jgi:hypothetical protein